MANSRNLRNEGKKGCHGTNPNPKSLCGNSARERAIGEILITKDKPATAREFWFTIVNNKDKVGIGTIVVAEGENRKLIGVVDQMETYSERSTTEQYVEGILPDQAARPRIRPSVVHIAKARVVAREPIVYSPPTGYWPVRLLSRQDVDILFRSIPKESRILCGFIRAQDDIIPVYVHSDFLLGDRGAHVNISGITGLATKTSYAVFLAYSALQWAKEHNRKLAVVMFNVKRGDLMKLHKLPKKEEWENKVREWANKFGIDVELQVRMWNEAIKEGLRQWEFGVKYFTFKGDETLPEDTPRGIRINISYGFKDINLQDFLAAIYAPAERVPDTQLNMLYAYWSAAEAQSLKFSDVKDHFKWYSEHSQGYKIPSHIPKLDNWRTDTAGAIYRRIDGFLHRKLRIILPDSPNGHPIKFNDLEPFKVNVVQLYGLDDSERRLLVSSLLREIQEGLMKRKGSVNCVLILVDELNQYAPKGGVPAIKEELINVAARGRDLFMSLIGVEQFASNIDGSIYGNCSTKVIGRSDEAELDSSIYRYLGGFKEIASSLNPGEMIVYHPTYETPLKVEFPVPLFRVTE